MQSKGRFGVGSVDGVCNSFLFHSREAVEREIKKAIKSLKVAYKRNPDQYGPMLAAMENATVVERTIIN